MLDASISGLLRVMQKYPTTIRTRKTDVPPTAMRIVVLSEDSESDAAALVLVLVTLTPAEVRSVANWEEAV